MPEPVPGEARMVGGRSRVGSEPIRVVVGAGLTRRGKTVGRELRIGRDVPLGIEIRTDETGDITIAPNEVVRIDDGSVGPAKPGLAGERGDRGWAGIKGLGGSRLAKVLLHMARLAITLEGGIEPGIVRTIGIPAGAPLGIGPFDGKAPHPLAMLILDGERIGDVMAGTTEFGALEHDVVIALVERKLPLLRRHVTTEDLTDIRVGCRNGRAGRQRPEPFGDIEA